MTSPDCIAGWQIAMAGLGSCAASMHHAGGVGNALGAGPIITDPASTLDEGHSVAAVTLDYQSLGGLSTQTLLSATAAMPPGSPESNNVHDLRTIQAYAISYAYGVTNDFTVAVQLPYVRRTGIREAVEQETATSKWRTSERPTALATSRYSAISLLPSEQNRACGSLWSQDPDGPHQRSHGARPTVRCRVSTRLRLLGPSLGVGVDAP